MCLVCVMSFGSLTGFAIFAGQPDAAAFHSLFVIVFGMLLPACSTSS
jgi:hypothetical protein